MLFVEASIMPGSGRLILTGHLGDVMKESAQAALSYARAHAGELDLAEDAFTSRDIHVHVPEGAIPKDGPSAGITMATALVSALSARPVRGDLAMTGEITLRGDVLAVGGIKEKVLAARRAGLRTVVLPASSRPHLEEISADLRRDMEFVLVEDVRRVLETALASDGARAGRRRAGGKRAARAAAGGRGSTVRIRKGRPGA
jgi:ATP-dependent Lon protease